MPAQQQAKRSWALDAIHGAGGSETGSNTAEPMTMGEHAEQEARVTEASKLGGPDWKTAFLSSLARSDRGRLEMMARRFDAENVKPVIDRKTGQLRNVLYRTGTNEPWRILNPEGELNLEDVLAVPWAVLKAAPAIAGGALAGPAGAIAGDVLAEVAGQGVAQAVAPEDVPWSERAIDVGVTVGAGLLGEAGGALGKAIARKASPSQRFARRVTSEGVLAAPEGAGEVTAARLKAAGKTRPAAEVARETIMPKGKRAPETDILTAGQVSRSQTVLDKENMLRRTEKFAPRIAADDQSRLANLTSTVYDSIEKLAGKEGKAAANEKASAALSLRAAVATEEIEKTLRAARNKAWKEGMAHVQSQTGDIQGFPMRKVDAVLSELETKVSKGRASETEEEVLKKIQRLVGDYRMMNGSRHASIGNIAGDLITLTDWAGQKGAVTKASDLTQEKYLFKQFKDAIVGDLDEIEKQTDAPLRTEAATALKAVRRKYAEDSAEIEDFMTGIGEAILGFKGAQKPEAIAGELLRGKYGNDRVAAYFRHLDARDRKSADALRAGVLVELVQTARPSASAALSAAGTEGEVAAGALSRFLRDNEGRLKAIFPERREAWMALRRVAKLADSMAARGVIIQPQGSQTTPLAEFIKSSLASVQKIPGVGHLVKTADQLMSGIPSDEKLYEMLMTREGRDILFGIIDPPKKKSGPAVARALYRFVEHLGRGVVERPRQATEKEIQEMKAASEREDAENITNPRRQAPRRFSDVLRQLTPEEEAQ